MVIKGYGKRIKLIREGHKLDQEPFAKKISLSRETVSKLENEAYPMSAKIAHIISSVYKVPFEWLYNNEGYAPFFDDDSLLQLNDVGDKNSHKWNDKKTEIESKLLTCLQQMNLLKIIIDEKNKLIDQKDFIITQMQNFMQQKTA